MAIPELLKLLEIQLQLHTLFGIAIWQSLRRTTFALQLTVIEAIDKLNDKMRASRLNLVCTTVQL